MRTRRDTTESTKRQRAAKKRRPSDRPRALADVTMTAVVPAPRRTLDKTIVKKGVTR